MLVLAPVEVNEPSSSTTGVWVVSGRLLSSWLDVSNEFRFEECLSIEDRRLDLVL